MYKSNIITPLTQKQIFDLNTKYSHIRATKSIMNKKNWWNHLKYWEYISRKVKLPEDFIDEFSFNLNGFYIMTEQKLSEKLIWKYFSNDNVTNLQLDTISQTQKLPENFIRHFKDRLDWYLICKYQTLPKEFIEEMKKEGYIK